MADLAKTVAVCTVFMIVGPTLMLVNKNIMDANGVGFAYPFTLSSLGLIFTTVVTRALHLSGNLELQQAHLVDRKFWMRNILPVGACHAATLAFGNAQYLYMGVALIQFLKAFTPMVVTVFSFVLLKKTVSFHIWVALIVACFGTSLTAAGDMSIQLFGLLLAVGSSCTEAIRLVLTQFALQDCKFSLLEGQYFLAPAGAFCLLGLGVVFEWQTIVERGDLGKIVEHPMQFAVAGGLGFGVQMLTSSVIKLTSSIAVKVLSQLRNALVVLSGVVLYGEVVNSMQLVGYVISVAGILRYSYLETQKLSPNLAQGVGGSRSGQGVKQAAADQATRKGGRESVGDELSLESLLTDKNNASRSNLNTP